MQQKIFHSWEAENVIISATNKLGLSPRDMQEYTNRPFFLIDTIHLKSGEVQKAIIEFRASVYKLGTIGVIPIGLNAEYLSEVRLGISDKIFSEDYRHSQTIDIQDLPFFTMPYNIQRAYGFWQLRVPILWPWIDAVIVVINESIGWIHRITELHEEEV